MLRNELKLGDICLWLLGKSCNVSLGHGICWIHGHDTCAVREGPWAWFNALLSLLLKFLIT